MIVLIQCRMRFGMRLCDTMTSVHSLHYFWRLRQLTCGTGSMLVPGRWRASGLSRPKQTLGWNNLPDLGERLTRSYWRQKAGMTRPKSSRPLASFRGDSFPLLLPEINLPHCSKAPPDSFSHFFYPAMPLLTISLISTRRFLARPAFVLFSATGSSCP